MVVLPREAEYAPGRAIGRGRASMVTIVCSEGSSIHSPLRNPLVMQGERDAEETGDGGRNGDDCETKATMKKIEAEPEA